MKKKEKDLKRPLCCRCYLCIVSCRAHRRVWAGPVQVPQPARGCKAPRGTCSLCWWTDPTQWFADMLHLLPSHASGYAASRVHRLISKGEVKFSLTKWELWTMRVNIEKAILDIPEAIYDIDMIENLRNVFLTSNRGAALQDHSS